jgi:transposase
MLESKTNQNSQNSNKLPSTDSPLNKPKKNRRPYYTHQVIELPEFKMKVLHFILNKGNCRNCGKIVKAKVTKEHQSGYDPRLSALIAEISGIQGNNV